MWWLLSLRSSWIASWIWVTLGSLDPGHDVSGNVRKNKLSATFAFNLANQTDFSSMFLLYCIKKACQEIEAKNYPGVVLTWPFEYISIWDLPGGHRNKEPAETAYGYAEVLADGVGKPSPFMLNNDSKATKIIETCIWFFKSIPLCFEELPPIGSKYTTQNHPIGVSQTALLGLRPLLQLWSSFAKLLRKRSTLVSAQSGKERMSAGMHITLLTDGG